MDSSDRKISIVVCVYNAEKSIAECLDSVFAQTYGDWELVCVDDGSSDGSVAIIERYAAKDARVRCFPRGRNYGLLSARKFGVRQATGDFIMFLDNDDMLAPEACQALLDELERTEADIVQFNPDFLFSESVDSEQRKKTESFFSVRRTGVVNGAKQILDACFCERAYTWNVWNKLYRASIVKAAYDGIEDEYMIMPEDAYAFFQIAARSGRLAIVDRRLYMYRVGCGVSTGGVSGSRILKEIETICHSIDVLRRFSGDRPELRDALAAYEKFMRRHVFHDFVAIDDPGLWSKSISDIVAVFSLEEVGRMVLAVDASLRRKDSVSELLIRALCVGRPRRCDGGKVGVICDAGTRAAFPAGDDLVFLDKLPSDEADRESALCDVVAREGIDIIVMPWRGNLIADVDFLIARFVLGRRVALSLPQCGAGGRDSLCLLEDIALVDAVVGDAGDVDWRAEARSAGNDGPMARASAIMRMREEIASRLATRYYDMLADSADERRLQVSEVARLHAATSSIPGLLRLRERYGADIDEYRIALVGSSAYFDRAWYRRVYPDVVTAGIDPVEHYVFHGWKEGRNPSSHFDTWYYLDQNPWLRDADLCPLVHFLESGIVEGMEPRCPASAVPAEDYRLFAESPFFDAAYYSSQIPGGACVGDPVVHYCTYGWRHGLGPSTRFNDAAYCHCNSDLRPGRLNLLLHYLRHGRNEGRCIFPFGYELIRDSGYFDTDRYCREHMDELGGMDPLLHYCIYGWRRGYAPSGKFSESKYAAFYMDLRGVGHPLLCHYLKWGRVEGRHPFPESDCVRWHWPDGFDRDGFMRRRGKMLVATHQLDFTGVPVLSRKIAELFAGEAALVSPSDGPLVESCLKAGVPVVVDSSFFVDSGRCREYSSQGFGFCIFNTIGVVRAFLMTDKVIPSLLWVHDNVDRDFLSQDVQSSICDKRNVYATSDVTRRHVKTYAPRSGYLPYPVLDVGGGIKSLPHERMRFGILARIEPRKGQDIAIEAFRQLPAEVRDGCELVIVGSVASKEFFTRIKSSAGGMDVVFRDAIRDQDAYHRTFDDLDFLICPSRTDPMPLVVMDAMMHGCPIIVSDQVGQHEFVEEGVNGYVFPCEDVRRLADAIAKAAGRRADFASMSRAVRKTFEENFECSKARQAIVAAVEKAKRDFKEAAT